MVALAALTLERNEVTEAGVRDIDDALKTGENVKVVDGPCELSYIHLFMLKQPPKSELQGVAVVVDDDDVVDDSIKTPT